MKKLIVLFIITIVAHGFISCEDQLNLKDPSALGTDNFIFDGESALSAMLDGYNDMQGDATGAYVTGAYPRMMQGLYSDDLLHPGSFPTLDEALVNNFQANNINVSRLFNQHYDLINTGTEVMRLTQELDPETEIDPELQSQIIAECHAMRAYGYLQLVKIFGGLPITELTYPLDGDAANDTPRSSEADVYAYILSEIQLAEGKLNPNNPVTQFTNDAVQVMKAEAYLFQENYTAVENTLTPLIGDYSLTETYAEVFDLNALENSTAIMRLNLNAADGGDLQLFFTSSGRREVSPSQSLVNAFEPNDSRLELISNPDDPTTSFINKFRSNTSFFPYIYRYEDVLFMYAEVLARRNSPEAATYLNLIRERAGLGPIGAFNASNVASVIAQERRVEFYGEIDRWETVKRLGLAQQVISSKGIAFTNRQLLWPIPQDEINRNALISQADQNPGY